MIKTFECLWLAWCDYTGPILEMSENALVLSGFTLHCPILPCGKYFFKYIFLKCLKYFFHFRKKYVLDNSTESHMVPQNSKNLFLPKCYKKECKSVRWYPVWPYFYRRRIIHWVQIWFHIWCAATGSHINRRSKRRIKKQEERILCTTDLSKSRIRNLPFLLKLRDIL